MRMIVEIMSGPRRGRKIVLGTLQSLQVGRTEWADFALPEDSRMSSIHFAFESESDACYVRDLGSSNGTVLNGRPLVQRMSLRSGDQIQAGETLFQVRMEDDTAAAAPKGDALALGGKAIVAPRLGTSLEASAAGPAMAAAAPSRRRDRVTYTLEPCPSGVSLCRGAVEELQPTDLALQLSMKIPLYLMVDVRKAGTAPVPPESLAGYLFDWLAPEVAALVSPIVLSHEYAEWPGLVEQGWGNDSVVCLFTRYEKHRLLEHLRHCMRAKPNSKDVNNGILGICWPSVLSLLLAHGPATTVGSLLLGIEAVLVEFPDLPETWQLFGTSRVAEMLDELGLTRRTIETPGS